jgi:SnoaL-like domain
MTDHIAALAHRNLLDVFGQRDPQARATAIRDVYAEDVVFADPEEVVVGREALNAKAQRLLDQAPDFVFTPVGDVRIVQDLAYLAWQLGPAGAPPAVSGADVSLVKDGRITHLWTILDTPAGPAA